QQALMQARTSARGVTGILRIGCTPATGGPALSRLAEEFSARYPGCEVTLHTVDIWDPYGDLRRGGIDVLVNWQAIDEADLVTGPVLEYRDRVLAVGRGHRLAGKESVSAEDLADEEIQGPWFPETFPAALRDAILPQATPSGRPIRRKARKWGGMEDIFTAISRTDLVHPTMTGVIQFQRDDIVLVPIRDMPPMPLGLIWHAAHENARIRALAAIAARQQRHRPPRPGPEARRATSQPRPAAPGNPGQPQATTTQETSNAHHAGDH
ncbi:MAG: hypothetical protein J2P33_24255, partial [Actinobacteria bacterium]|nr:hypothetical protein [Actinomycetota bacterium]